MPCLSFLCHLCWVLLVRDFVSHCYARKLWVQCETSTFVLAHSYLKSLLLLQHFQWNNWEHGCFNFHDSVSKLAAHGNRAVTSPRCCKFLQTTMTRLSYLCIGEIFSWNPNFASFIYNIHALSLPAWHFCSPVDVFIAFSQGNIAQELDWGMESQTLQGHLKASFINKPC